MKTIDEFLSYLYSLDIKLWIDGDRLHCSAPEEALTPTLSAQLQDRKAEILTFLNQVNLALHSTYETIKPISREGELPLSFAQQRLWFLDQLQPGSVYNIPVTVHLTGLLRLGVLEQTINEIVRRHETLRTTLTKVEGQPVQVIAPTLTLALPLVDLRQFSEVERKAEVVRLATEEAQRSFDLAKGPLLRITLVRLDEAEHIVLFTIHHVVSDAWSMGVLIRELAALYEAFLTGKPSPLPDLPIQYADFAAWQRQWLQGDVLEAQLSYWRQQLAGTLPVLQLPTDFPRSRIQTFQGGRKTFSLTGELTRTLKALSQQENVTLFMTLLAAFKTLLHRYTGQYDILVGSPIANRNRAEIEGLIGFFVNTLVLRTNLAGNPTFRELLNQVREVTWEAYDHQDLPFEKLVEELQPERDLSYNPLFQVKFMLENAPKEDLKLPGLTLSSLKQENPTAKLDLSLDMFETPSGLMGVFEYNKELFDAATIDRMVRHFCTLLSGIVNNSDQRLSDLPLLTEAELHQLLVEWNNTQTDYPKDQCLHQLFESQVEQTPDAVAVVFKNEQLTYRELNRRSNQLAHHLNKLGVGPEVLVGICVERASYGGASLTLEMVVGLLGILKAGGAYVPLDPAYPQERLTFMLSDSQIPVLLTQENLVVGLPEHRAHLVCLDTDWGVISQESEKNPVSGVKTENLAYLIYTSGSTGTPKGVLVTHAGLGNLTEDKIRTCNVQPDSCVLQFFSLSFDASIPEFVMALGSGAKLCLGTLDSLLPGPALVQLLREQAITHITITPSALAALPNAELPALRMVLVGGEACSTELIAQWSKGRLFINAYGPTEVTVNASMVECGNGGQKLPTVRPSANKQLYILDQNLQPVPIGVPGELCISGVGLARGYLNRPDKTAAAFIPNPFADSKFSRLYKTGDLACYLSDGNIKLFGRLDNQVKIRGFRIELGEIEALLTQHSKVRASVVIARSAESLSGGDLRSKLSKTDNSGDKRLVAYIVPESELFPTPNDLRCFLKEKLPEYMVPAAFVILEALPLTPNGKVDHWALPAPDMARSILEEAFVAPRTPTEKVLAEIFAQVLEVEPVGVYDDFFELGGHSLLATKLISRLLQVFQMDLTVVDLFKAPTVVGLAEHIEKMQRREQLQAPILDMMDEREEIEL